MANGCKVGKLKYTPILRAKIRSTVLAYSYFIFNLSYSNKPSYKYAKRGILINSVTARF